MRSVHAIAPNVLGRDFTATAPNHKWVADFTYLPQATVSVIGWLGALLIPHRLGPQAWSEYCESNHGHRHDSENGHHMQRFVAEASDLHLDKVRGINDGGANCVPDWPATPSDNSGHDSDSNERKNKTIVSSVTRPSTRAIPSGQGRLQSAGP